MREDNYIWTSTKPIQEVITLLNAECASGVKQTFKDNRYSCYINWRMDARGKDYAIVRLIDESYSFAARGLRYYAPRMHCNIEATPTGSVVRGYLVYNRKNLIYPGMVLLVFIATLYLFLTEYSFSSSGFATFALLLALAWVVGLAVMGILYWIFHQKAREKLVLVYDIIENATGTKKHQDKLNSHL